MKDVLKNIDASLEIDNLDVREEFSHQGPNFLDATLKLDGEPIMKLRGTGYGDVMLERTEDGAFNESALNNAIPNSYSVTRFVTEYVMWKTGF